MLRLKSDVPERGKPLVRNASWRPPFGTERKKSPAITSQRCATPLQQKKAYYEALRGLKNSNDEEIRTRATDIATWQSDPLELAEGLANYAIATKKNLKVVMDNVDKMDLKNQLLAFQLTLWFMERTRAFTVLQMRDETYERYKNKKPLDTFRAGIAFHIAPPRFIDVIKRRLELGVEYLAAHAAEKQEYTDSHLVLSQAA